MKPVPFGKNATSRTFPGLVGATPVWISVRFEVQYTLTPEEMEAASMVPSGLQDNRLPHHELEI